MARCLPVPTFTSKLFTDLPSSEDETWWPILSGDEAAGMVPYSLAPGEQITMCPYDRAHWFRLSKSQNHLYRCRKNYAKSCEMNGINFELQKVECRFNPIHILDTPEKIFHEFQCSYREKCEEEQLKDVARYAPQFEENPHTVIRPEEEWRPDRKMLSYDPRRKLKLEAFIIPHGNSVMNKSDKKAFQASQRWHFFTRASGPVWKDLGADEPEIVKQAIVLPEEKEPSASEMLAELRMNQINAMDLLPPPSPRPGRRILSLNNLYQEAEVEEEPQLPEGQCIKFVNNFFTGKE